MPRAAASSRPSARRERPARAGLAAALERHVGWMLRAGTTTFEAKSGYGLDRETELAQLRAIRAAGGVPDLARRARGSARVRRRRPGAYVDFLLAEVLPEAARIAEAADVFLERGAFDVDEARRYLRACAEAGLAASPARRPVHRVGSDPARDRARRALGRPPGEHRRRPASPRSPPATSSACSCRRARSSSADRCRPHGRSPTREPRSRSRRTSTPEAPSARACRSSARSPARSSGSVPRRRSPRAP